MPRAAFTTLGCKVNQYETQQILESFEKAGFRVVPFNSPAEVYVINSCSVTAIAESKSRYMARKAARTNPNARIVLTGCAAQMAANLGNEFEGVDVWVPNPEKTQTINYLFRECPDLEKRALEAKPNRESATKAFQGRTRATLKVQDGCNICCSYCSIPSTRPVMRSRHYREVLDEAKHLVQMGYKEAVLTGILIGSYNQDTGSGGPGLEALIELLAANSGLDRIRISSIEMGQVSLRLMKALSNGWAVPHLHIPLQSGDTRVLRDMNRPYTRDDFIQLCDILYDAVPDIAITTDIMVGFPTETEERFQSSVDVCQRVGFLKGHIFRFSPRPGTPAYERGDRISSDDKLRRSQELTDLTAETGSAYMQRFVGRTMRVLVEGKHSKSGMLSGFTDNYIEVHFAGPSSLARNFCHVTICQVQDGLAFGELAQEPSTTRTNLFAWA